MGVLLTASGFAMAGAAPGANHQPPPAAEVAPAAAPSGIVEMTISRRSGVVSAWLGNGVRVHHRRMSGVGLQGRSRGGDNRAGSEAPPRVLITIALAGGELHESQADRGLTAAATLAWRMPATRSRDAETMGAFLKARNIEVVGYAAGDAMILSVESPAAELGAALGVAAELVTEPVVDPRAVEGWVHAYSERLERSNAEPKWAVSAALREGVRRAGEAAEGGEGASRLRPLTAADLRRLDAGRVQSWLDALVTGASAEPKGAPPMEVSIVGDVGAAEALGLVEGTLAGLALRERIGTGTLANARAGHAATGPVEVRLERSLPAGKALAGVGFFGTDGLDLPRHRELSMAAMVLDERLTIRVRERGWGSISDVLVMTTPGGFGAGESGVVLPAVLVDARHADGAAELIAGLISEFARSGPTPDEFRRARAQFLREVGKTLPRPEYWAAVLASSTYRGYTPDEVAAAQDVTAALTPEAITAAVREHATAERVVRVFVEGATTEEKR